MRTADATAATTTEEGLVPMAGGDFVGSPERTEHADRAVAYLEAGYPVHFSGPVGSGKTTLAWHVAHRLRRPVSLVHGRDEFGGGDPAGRDSWDGRSSVVEDYVSAVLGSEEAARGDWVQRRLAIACQRGHTVIYDEFDRTRPEAVSMLLGILEQGIVEVPPSHGSSCIVVHRAFRLILTSSPMAGTGRQDARDALLDRLVTIELDACDRQSEVAITASRSGMSIADASTLVGIARTLRSRDPGWSEPTLRSVIALAQVLRRSGVPVDPDDERFLGFAWDIFGRAVRRTSPDHAHPDRRAIAELMRSIESTSGDPAS